MAKRNAAKTKRAPRQATSAPVERPAPVALALIEFGGIASGMLAGDAMVKKAPIERLLAGTVQPGKYLVLISGGVADVEESFKAGRAAGGSDVIDVVFLPQVHPAVVNAIVYNASPGRTRDQTSYGAALGIIETNTVAAAIHAADAGVKGADVALLELRMADGLHGKGLVLYSGALHDVEAAVEIGAGVLDRSLLINQVVIAQLHGEMGSNILARTRFGENVDAGMGNDATR